MAKGKIVQVIGAVVDIEFPLGELPEILNAVTIKGKSGDVDIDLVVEVMQHLGDSVTRCIAMSSTDGLVRGMEAEDTGAPIKVPVGPECLGRVFNVLGDTVDHNPEPVGNKEAWPIHRPAPTFEEQDATAQILVTAPDGTRRVYVIYQHIIRSSEARLRMIWLDADTLRRYEMDTLHYEIVLPQGAIMPVITAEPLDSLATWELGMPVETESGTTVDVYGIAEDGTMLTYSLTFTFANWAPSAEVDSDDYFFFYLGDGRYKAVTIGIGVQFAVYDMAGRIVMLQELPTANPSDVEVEVQADGNQILRRATPDAEGAVFHARAGQPYFYVFYDSKTKRVAKGGKFEWRN